MRLSYDGGRNYPRRLEGALSAEPPPCPAAVHVYDGSADGVTRVLAADFDTKRAAARGAADPAGQVAADAAAFAALVKSCGGRGFGDISPNGGRHGYVLWAAPVPYGEMRRVALALARRYISLDPLPMLGREHGLIRPPGSRHRGGGVQRLTTPLEHALACVRSPNGPAVWERLCAALHTELEAVDRGDSPLPAPAIEAAPQGAQWRVDEAGAPWLPRPGGRVPRLRPDLELTAASGGYDTGRYRTPSEARFAVLCSAAARGWRLEEVTERLRSGAWEGLCGFYDRYRPGQRARSLLADWRKAVTVAAGAESGRASDARENHHRGAPPPCGGSERGEPGDVFCEIRRIDNAVRAAERHRWPGRHGITIRLVMRALLAAAQMTGSTIIEFGARNLAIQACLDHATVARTLAELRAEPDPFVVLLESERGVRGDLYRLRVPGAYASAAAWRRWRPGRIGVHPVFQVLGGAAALVCEQLTGEPVRTIDLPALTGLSSTAVGTALAGLAAEGMAERGLGGWRRGAADLDQVADRLGVPEILEAIQAEHRRDRQRWHMILGHIPPVAVLFPSAPAHPPEMVDSGVGPCRPAAVRGPPVPDRAAAAAIAELQAAGLGPVQVIAA